MAFNPANNTRNTNNANANTNEAWKADAFLNFFLPRKNGGKMLIGGKGIALRELAKNDKMLMDFIDANPEENMQKILKSIQIEYVPVTNEVSEEMTLDL